MRAIQMNNCIVLNQPSLGGGAGGGGILEGGGSYEEGGANTSTSRGAIASSSANTKSSWVELIASTAAAGTGILITMDGQNFSSRKILLDIGLGAPASETVLIGNIYYQTGPSSADQSDAWFFPCDIPAGSRVSARVQGSGGTTNVGIVCHVLQGNTGTASTGNETLGVTEGITSVKRINFTSETANTKSGYVELGTSTADYKQIFVGVAGTNTAANDTYILWDLATGAASSEVDLLKNLVMGVDSSADREVYYVGPIPVDTISSGTRFSFRAQSSEIGSGVTFGCFMIGIS